MATAGKVLLTLGLVGAAAIGIPLLVKGAGVANAGNELSLDIDGIRFNPKKDITGGNINITLDVVAGLPTPRSLSVDFIQLDIRFPDGKKIAKVAESKPGIKIAGRDVTRFPIKVKIPIAQAILNLGLKVFNSIKTGNWPKELMVSGKVVVEGFDVDIDKHVPLTISQ